MKTIIYKTQYVPTRLTFKRREETDGYFCPQDVLDAAKNCPFCGCDNLGFVDYESRSNKPFEERESAIECRNCMYEIFADTPEELIEKWNRRF